MMIIAAIVLALQSAPDVAPPVVGRPADFSGAVGGPFVVQWLADRIDVTAEEPIALTLRITGPGDLATMPRPPLGKLDAFKPLAVDDLDDGLVPGEPPRREFRYRVRPRTAAATEIPRFKFVYFNPKIVPASRGYQTTYADPLRLTVKPRPSPVMPGASAVPEWMLRDESHELYDQPPRSLWRDRLGWVLAKVGLSAGDTGMSVGWWPVVIVLAVPPVVCGLWWTTWRRVNPDAARLAAGRRSRAAAAAIRALGRAGIDRPDLVAAAVRAYLRDRIGLSATATTPAEIAAELSKAGCPSALVSATTDLARRCDAARFAPDSGPDELLAPDAERVILEWEAAGWAPFGS
jgi:hypothetical protein